MDISPAKSHLSENQNISSAFSLGLKKDEDSLNKLLSLLQEDSWKVRRAAVESLGNMGDPKSIPHLLEMLSDSSWKVQQGSVFALGYIYRDMIKDDACGDSPELSKESIQAVKKEIKEKLLLLLKNPEWRIRQAVVSSLRFFSADDSLQALKESLRDEDWHVRCTATESLGELKAAEAVPEIKALLKNADPAAARIIQKALDTISGKPPAEKKSLTKRPSPQDLPSMGSQCPGCAGEA